MHFIYCNLKFYNHSRNASSRCSLDDHKMHKLFEQVLEKKDLSKAGDLFSLEDSVIVDELSDVIKTIQVGKFQTYPRWSYKNIEFC